MTGDGPVVVVGGTRMLCGQVVTALLSRGKQVRALVRPGSDAACLERAGADSAPGDMMDPASPQRDGRCGCTTAASYTRHSKGDTVEIHRTGLRIGGTAAGGLRQEATALSQRCRA